MEFENPTNGYRETAGGVLSWLWVLLLGPLYWVVKGVWRHALLHFILVCLTAGIASLIYPFFTYAILRRHYQRRGWRKISAYEVR